MTAKVFMQVTGLTKGKLREMRQAKSLYYVRLPGWTNYMYWKADAALVAGFTFN
jgi:hypothetical protein